MDNNLIYMPTFRYRQQESQLLSSFDFGENIYPLIEIVKEHDRVRKVQKKFEEIYLPAINKINAQFVFVDLPVYLKQLKSVKPDVNNFIIRVINNIETRCEYLNKLSELSDKIIPVIASYYGKRKELNTISRQFELLRPKYSKLAFRIFLDSFDEDFDEIKELVRPNDYIIIDIDKTLPFITRPLKSVFDRLDEFKAITKIVLRSAINSDVENVKLEHGKVILEADNSHIESHIYQALKMNAIGDYVGIKKDNLTEGGSISPGFIYFDATENQFYGFKASIKDLKEFEDRIVPSVLRSHSTKRMISVTPPFLSNDNKGYKTLVNISIGNESGKNQAKFKRISMEHYLYCIKILIENGVIKQENV